MLPGTPPSGTPPYGPPTGGPVHPTAPTGPTGPLSPPPVAPPTGRGRNGTAWVLGGVAALLAVALLGVSVAYVGRSDDLDAARADAERAAAEAAQARADAAELEARITDLEQRLADAEAQGGSQDGTPGSSGDPLQDALDGLLNGDSPGDVLGDLFEGLLGELGDAFGDAFGDITGDLGGLGDGLGGGFDTATQRCLTEGITPAAGGAAQGDAAAQIRAIAAQVEAERGLRFTNPVRPQLLGSAEFEQRIRALVEAGYDDTAADLDTRTLTLLGAIPQGSDLKDAQVENLADQVAGFYDPATGEVVVKVDDPSAPLGALERITLAHELDHALTDQVLGLPDSAVAGDTDGNLARLALIEGDATLLMQRWSLEHVSLMDQLGNALEGLVQGFGGAAGGGVDSPYLQRQLLFPYTDGLSYACRLFDENGWRSIDAAYDATPASTAEVLFADRAGAVNERTASLSVPAGYDRAREDTIGAAQLLWLFEAPGGDTGAAIDDARGAAKRWAGGRTLLATDGDRSALGVALRDTADGGALCDAVTRWYDAAVTGDRRAADGDVTVFSGADRNAVVRCSGRDVRIGIADVLDAARGVVR